MCLEVQLMECTWHVDATVRPAWNRQKVLPAVPKKANVIAKRLQRRGWRVGRFNWDRALDAIYDLPPRRMSSYLARFALDVPVHQNMAEEELQTIAREVMRQ